MSQYLIITLLNNNKYGIVYTYIVDNTIYLDNALYGFQEI